MCQSRNLRINYANMLEYSRLTDCRIVHKHNSSSSAAIAACVRMYVCMCVCLQRATSIHAQPEVRATRLRTNFSIVHTAVFLHFVVILFLSLFFLVCRCACVRRVANANFCISENVKSQMRSCYLDEMVEKVSQPNAQI